MYKITYNDENSTNIESITIDVRDIDNMKYIDIIHNGDIYLLLLYVKCLKYYKRKINLNNHFTIENNFIENENIIKSVLNCEWLINEDDVISNLDKLEETNEKFQEEINFLGESNAKP